MTCACRTWNEQVVPCHAGQAWIDLCLAAPPSQNVAVGQLDISAKVVLEFIGNGALWLR